MSSYRNHRVIIATLFLPQTAVLGESPPQTPHPLPTQLPSLFNLKIPERPPYGRKKTPVLKSIVEDMRDKVGLNPQPIPLVIAVSLTSSTQTAKSSRIGTPMVITPNSEQSNPFASIGEVVGSPVISPPDSAVKHEHQTTHRGTNPQSSRFARRSPMLRQRSLSANRRGESDSPAARPAWHTEPNPHANGGLYNAVRSVGSRIRRRLWVGTLGTHTDTFKDNLKRSIDKRMFEKVESVPVWIPDAEFEKCYDEFCHQV